MKKILFTGARSGISGSVIEKIASNDYFIYLTVHKENEVKTAKERYGKYKNITIFKLDITDQNDRNKLKSLDLDIIVLNAAVGFGGSILDIDMNNFREVNDDILKDWLSFREETELCFVNDEDRKHTVEFDEISERILKNVPKQNKKYVEKQLNLLNDNFLDYIDYWNEKYYRNGFCDGVELIGRCCEKQH